MAWLHAQLIADFSHHLTVQDRSGQWTRFPRISLQIHTDLTKLINISHVGKLREVACYKILTHAMDNGKVCWSCKLCVITIAKDSIQQKNLRVSMLDPSWWYLHGRRLFNYRDHVRISAGLLRSSWWYFLRTCTNLLASTTTGAAAINIVSLQ